MAEKYYEYNNQLLSLAQLEQIAGVHRETIRTRINKGWTVEAAATTVSVITHSPPPSNTMSKKQLIVRFPRRIMGVFLEMQPARHRTYVATPHLSVSKNPSSKLYYTIILDNGKNLIVYPDEFEVVSVLPNEP